MPTYEMTGTLTAPLEEENVQAAQEYLTADAMEEYLDESLSAVKTLTWQLLDDGYNYVVTAVASRNLTPAELKLLGEEVSGQNSDGLGEGFEQQNFAESEDGMVSFDWTTNPHTFVEVK